MPSCPAQGSGIIIRMAWGSERPVITRNSSTLSNVAVSLPPSRRIGRIFARSAARIGLVLDALADHVQLALEAGRIIISGACRRRAARDENLFEDRLDRRRARSNRAVVGRHVAPPEQVLPFLGHDPHHQLLGGGAV